MSEINVDGIVLRRRDSVESDRRLTVFSRELGKVDLVAKGARKAASRLAGVSEPLTVARFTFAAGKANRYITQAAPLASFRGFRQDYDRLRLGLCLLELADAVLPYQHPDEQVFSLLKFGIQALDSHERPEVAFVWSQLQLLDASGFLPQFACCVVTEQPLKENPAWFSYNAGGYVHSSEAGSFPDRELVAAEILIGLARTLALEAPPQNLKRAEEARRLLYKIWRHVVSNPLPANDDLFLN